MEQLEPLRFNLDNSTVQALRLEYAPYHWPSLGKYAFQGGFSITEPWEGFKEKAWYAADIRQYEIFTNLLRPHQGRWIEADCVAAFVPDQDGRSFSVHINGLAITTLSESTELRRRMLLQKLPILVSTCNARIFGGGRTTHGDKRGYGIALDLKPFKR